MVKNGLETQAHILQKKKFSVLNHIKQFLKYTFKLGKEINIIFNSVIYDFLSNTLAVYNLTMCFVAETMEK